MNKKNKIVFKELKFDDENNDNAIHIYTKDYVNDLKQELTRLKNIIDELEKYIENTNNWFIEFKPEEKLIKKSYICIQDLKNKLKELKEGKENE